jgi:hypothetical protein
MLGTCFKSSIDQLIGSHRRFPPSHRSCRGWPTYPRRTLTRRRWGHPASSISSSDVWTRTTQTTVYTPSRCEGDLRHTRTHNHTHTRRPHPPIHSRMLCSVKSNIPYPYPSSSGRRCGSCRSTRPTSPVSVTIQPSGRTWTRWPTRPPLPRPSADQHRAFYGR